MPSTLYIIEVVLGVLDISDLGVILQSMYWR